MSIETTRDGGIRATDPRGRPITIWYDPTVDELEDATIMIAIEDPNTRTTEYCVLTTEDALRFMRRAITVIENAHNGG